MRALVIIPTFNERESLPVQLAAVRASVPEVDVLVVDDGSPDGTGEWADEAAASDPQVHVMHRTSKDGLGAAYIAGFGWGLERGYDILCEMDADGSHRAQDLAAVLAGVSEPSGLAGLSIGSRWVHGGAIENWPFYREALSRGANLYVQLALGIGVRDATAGFRAYRAEVLRSIALDEVESRGYCFQIDMAWRALRAGAQVSETPITFVERTAGASKMTGDIIVEALWKVTVWGATHRWRQLTGYYRRQQRAA